MAPELLPRRGQALGPQALRRRAPGHVAGRQVCVFCERSLPLAACVPLSRSTRLTHAHRFAVFDVSGARVAATSTPSGKAFIYDTVTAQEVQCLVTDPLMASGGGPLDPRSAKSYHHISFDPQGAQLALWGTTLWDLRTPRPLHRFDYFSDSPVAGCFHPASPEIILNSEVWDLRTFRLLRSVPSLDQLQLKFSPGKLAVRAPCSKEVPGPPCRMWAPIDRTCRCLVQTRPSSTGPSGGHRTR